MNKRAKACDISAKVKREVFDRDGGCCVVCGNSYNVMPNAHFLSRSHGGLGIPENIVTLCTGLTPNQCHYRYDFGTKDQQTLIKAKIKAYLMNHYPDWDETKLIYRKQGFYAEQRMFNGKTDP